MTFVCPRCGRLVTNDHNGLTGALPAHYAEGCQVFPAGPGRKDRAAKQGLAEALHITGGPPTQENVLPPTEQDGFVISKPGNSGNAGKPDKAEKPPKK